MKAKKHPLKVLIIEDSENDAMLLELELERSGYQPACHRVETPESLEAALQSEKWDLIIADYVMPHFNGLAALSLVKERGSTCRLWSFPAISLMTPPSLP